MNGAKQKVLSEARKALRCYAEQVGGVWRTVRGRRIFIKEGETAADAMKRSLGGRGPGPGTRTIRGALGQVQRDWEEELATHLKGEVSLRSRKEPGDRGLASMVREDLLDLRKVADALKAKDYKKAGRILDRMDTAPREDIVVALPDSIAGRLGYGHGYGFRD